MRTDELPTWETIQRNTLDKLNAARQAAAGAADWARSDWCEGSATPADLGSRRFAVTQAVSRIEAAVDQAKDALEKGVASDGDNGE